MDAFSFDLAESIIRLNLTVHMSDVSGAGADEGFSRRIADFIASADKFDSILVETYGSASAPETQLAFLIEPNR